MFLCLWGCFATHLVYFSSAIINLFPKLLQLHQLKYMQRFMIHTCKKNLQFYNDMLKFDLSQMCNSYCMEITFGTSNTHV